MNWHGLQSKSYSPEMLQNILTRKTPKISFLHLLVTSLLLLGFSYDLSL
eukprot:UN21361